MGKNFTITLTENELGQLLDGLTIRAESWENTADFLRSGIMPEGERFIIEDCSKPTEADQIARQYRSIIKDIARQMEVQE